MWHSICTGFYYPMVANFTQDAQTSSSRNTFPALPPTITSSFTPGLSPSLYSRFNVHGRADHPYRNSSYQQLNHVSQPALYVKLLLLLSCLNCLLCVSHCGRNLPSPHQFYLLHRPAAFLPKSSLTLNPAVPTTLSIPLLRQDS